VKKFINKKIAKLFECKGYTLIELIVVIGVIGVLAGALVVLIDPATQLRRARDAQRKSDLSQIQSAIEIYRADLEEYPSLSGCGLELTGGTPPNTYMTQVPCDPLPPPSTNYFYSANETFSTYCLRACLENTSDQGRDSTNNFNCENVETCPSEKVSYTVRNP